MCIFEIEPHSFFRLRNPFVMTQFKESSAERRVGCFYLDVIQKG